MEEKKQNKQAAFDRRLIERGGRKLGGIRLVPEAAKALSKLEECGMSATKIINNMLIERGSS